SACKFSDSDKTFVYTLMVEYNKEQLAKEGSIWNLGEAEFSEKGADSVIGKCAKDVCVTHVVGKPITSSKDIENRAMARAIFGAMKDWSTTDYTPDELERKNRITNATACAGQAVQVLGGMKEQILSPLLGTVMPGAGGEMEGGGGGLGGMLGGLGGLLGGGGQ
ncbi:MAG: hypothetical protein JXQ74_04460, partial [Alphaproteobacteria bacterium]|nr:hypothetical protein [Alphaproteobacteria bacterium]